LAHPVDEVFDRCAIGRRATVTRINWQSRQSSLLAREWKERGRVAKFCR